jgi:large subunit ribosomal protein L46
MAGQANLAGNTMGYKDFNWLTKEELMEKFAFPYYRAVKNMMVDR